MTGQRLGRSSSVLVDALCARSSAFAHVVSQLRRRAPCAKAARTIVAAFERGRFEHWDAACLLGSVRHEIGYEAVLGMFTDSRLIYAGSYLADALLSINRERAEADFCRLVMLAATQIGRDEAASGLGMLLPSAPPPALLRAAAAGSVQPRVAARVLVGAAISPEAVASWLASKNRAEVELACAVVAVAAWRPTSTSSGDWSKADRRQLLDLARTAVNQGRADPKPYVRTGLRRPTQNYALARLG